MTFRDAGHKGNAPHTFLNVLSFHFSHPFNSHVKVMEFEDFGHLSGISEYFRVSQRNSSYFQISHISEVESLRVHPCCAGTWVSVQEDPGGELGTCARSPAMTCWRYLGFQRLSLTSPGFWPLQAALGKPGGSPADQSKGLSGDLLVAMRSHSLGSRWVRCCRVCNRLESEEFQLIFTSSVYPLIRNRSFTNVDMT